VPARLADARDEFEAAAKQLGGRADVHTEVQALFDADEPAGLIEAMRAALLSDARRALGDEGGDDIEFIAEQIIDRFLKWLVHLVAAAGASHGDLDGEVLHVMSRDHWNDAPWPGARRTRIVRLDCSHDDLLRRPETVDAIVSGLAPASRQPQNDSD
jgi:hypothetical protein